MKGFPLPGLLRRSAEGHMSEAGSMLRIAETDIRSLLEGGERSDTFDPNTDPVGILIEAARQFQRCKTVLQIDDEVRKEQDGTAVSDGPR